MTEGLFEVLEAAGLSTAIEVKIYRHADSRFDLIEMERSGLIDAYQSIHSQHRLGDGMVGFFMGEQDRVGRFLGMWNVRHVYPGRARTFLPRSAVFYGSVEESDYYYVLERDPRFDKLINHLKVAWPAGRSNDRWLVRPDRQVVDFEVVSL